MQDLGEERGRGPASGAASPHAGIWAPLLTAVGQELEPDPARTAEHARRLLEQGCAGLLLFGSTGEAPSFTTAERIDLLDDLLEAGIEPERLMVGTGCCAFHDSVRLTRHASRNGCERILMLPPYYYTGVGDDGVFTSYAAIIDRLGGSKLQLFLYNFPRYTGVPISVQLVERLLTAFPGVVAGVKDSSGDWDSTRALLTSFPQLAVFPGTERLLQSALESGAPGCITATANVNAPALGRAYKALVEGSTSAGARCSHVVALREAIEAYPIVPALKALVALDREDPAWRYVRPPFEPLSDAAAERLRAALGGLRSPSVGRD